MTFTQELRICDHKECPAASTHLVLTTAGEVVLCGHHFNDSVSIIMDHGYTVHIRPDLATV